MGNLGQWLKQHDMEAWKEYRYMKRDPSFNRSRNLAEAFAWSNSPSGYHYWSRLYLYQKRLEEQKKAPAICSKVKKLIPLSDLGWWLRQYDTEAWLKYRYIEMRAMAQPGYAHFKKYEDSLMHSFSWAKSIGSFEYWSKKHTGLARFKKQILGNKKPKAEAFNQIVPYCPSYDSIESLAHTFYMCQELAMVKPVPTIKCLREYAEWHAHLLTVKKDLEERMAKTLRDTLALMCFGEVRHYRDHYYDADPEIAKCLHEAGIWQEASRLNTYGAATRLNWAEVEKLIPLFDSDAWGAGYGGPKWANIAKRVVTYSSRSSICFCDATFGLVHNGGVVFDKEIFVNTYAKKTFEGFLDFRRENSLLNYKGYRPEPLWLDTEVYYILEDAVRLGMVKSVECLPAGTLQLKTADWKHGTLNLEVK